MLISEIYNRYNIMPALQLHMYRVASVASVICRNTSLDLKADEIVAACLLHDMGNIIKINLQILPELLEPEGAEYWGTVKARFVEKYGPDENQATRRIAEEVGVNPRVLELIDSFGFIKTMKIYRSNDPAKQICCYADTRVTPLGVASLKERIEEGRKRHLRSGKAIQDDDRFNEIVSYLEKIEQRIFEHCALRPEEITESSIKQDLGNLRKFDIR